MRSWWFKLSNEGVADDSGLAVTEQGHPTWPPARCQALHLTPCRGAVAVVVYDPFGDVFAHWDRFSNVARGMWNDEQTEARAKTLQEAWEADLADGQANASPAIVQPEAASPPNDLGRSDEANNLGRTEEMNDRPQSPIAHVEAALPMSDQASVRPIASAEEEK